jgi:hypothetical protein
LNIVEDRILRGGQGARGEEKDGKHRSGFPNRKRGKNIPPKNRIKETKRKTDQKKKKSPKGRGKGRM